MYVYIVVTHILVNGGLTRLKRYRRSSCLEEFSVKKKKKQKHAKFHFNLK